MSISRLINRPCELVLRDEGGTDALGNPTTTEARFDAVCEVQQARRDEPVAAGETSDTRWLIWLLPDVEDDLPRRLDTGDAVEVDGDVYELVGDPDRVRDPWRRTTHHIELSARRVGSSEEGS